MWIETAVMDSDTVKVQDARYCDGQSGFILEVTTNQNGVSRRVAMTPEQAADVLASLLSMGVVLNEKAQRLLGEYGVVSI